MPVSRRRPLQERGADRPALTPHSRIHAYIIDRSHQKARESRRQSPDLEPACGKNGVTAAPVRTPPPSPAPPRSAAPVAGAPPRAPGDAVPPVPEPPRPRPERCPSSAGPSPPLHEPSRPLHSSSSHLGRAELERILLNLATNAREATFDGGTVEIRTRIEGHRSGMWRRRKTRTSQPLAGPPAEERTSRDLPLIASRPKLRALRVPASHIVDALHQDSCSNL